jgi:3-oxoacyl-[acyl-carrier protein] reductase
MVKRKFGRIVNAASFAAYISNLNRGVYAAAKAGVIALTEVWAGELAPYGITVNAYIPGSIMTEMTADQRGVEEELLLNRISLRRFGTPEEVGRVVAFLLSPAADYLTGTAIDVSGGKFVVQNPGDAWKGKMSLRMEKDEGGSCKNCNEHEKRIGASRNRWFFSRAC